MANIILPTGGRFDRQPQGLAEIDWTTGFASAKGRVFTPFSEAALGRPRIATPSGVATRFLGTSGVAVPGINHTGPITLVAVVTPATTVGNQVVAGAFGSASGFGAYIQIEGGFYRAYHTDGNNWVGGGTVAAVVGRPAVLVGVFSATGLSLYVDGYLTYSTGTGRSPYVTDFRIGSAVGNDFLTGGVSFGLFEPRRFALPEIASISANPWQLFRDDTSDILIFDMGAGGGASQSVAFTLDDATASISQTLGHGQALGITLDDITSSVSQSLGHDQSTSITLDDVTANIAQEIAGAKSQSVSITLDDVTAAVSQTASHPQSLAVTLDDVSATINQSAASPNKDQSLAITLDDLLVDIKQVSPRRRQAGGRRNYVIKGKRYHLNDYELSVMIQGMLEEVERKDVQLDDGEVVKKVSRRVWSQLKKTNAQLDFTLKELTAKVAVEEIDDEDDIALLML